MGSEISQLIERVRDDLLDESQSYGINIIDSHGNTTYNNVSVINNNPFHVDWGRFLPDYMDLPRFWDVANDLITDAQDREGVLEANRVRLVEDFRPEQFSEFGNGNEVISYSVISRLPGSNEPSGEGRRQTSYRHHVNLRSPKDPNKMIEVESRPVDHKVQFTCWAKTSQLANQRALWLENLFIDHSWAFEIKGAERFHWIERGRDTFWGPSGQNLAQRPLVFFLRLRVFRLKLHSIIQQVLAEVSHT